LAALRAHLRERAYEQVDVLLFPHGVRSAGIAEPQDWLRLREFAGDVRLPATDARRYPADFRALATYSSAIPRGDRRVRVNVRTILDALDRQGHVRAS
jgi:hypothetical protein